VTTRRLGRGLVGPGVVGTHPIDADAFANPMRDIDAAVAAGGAGTPVERP